MTEVRICWTINGIGKKLKNSRLRDLARVNEKYYNVIDHCDPCLYLILRDTLLQILIGFAPFFGLQDADHDFGVLLEDELIQVRLLLSHSFVRKCSRDSLHSPILGLRKYVFKFWEKKVWKVHRHISAIFLLKTDSFSWGIWRHRSAKASDSWVETLGLVCVIMNWMSLLRSWKRASWDGSSR